MNAVCPYYTMYPLDFPLRVLKEHGKRGDWVIDPFCGRGTTNFAARLLQMPSVGVDSSPVAVAITQAKLASAPPSSIVASARAILKAAKEPTALPTGEFWKLAYHEHTLVQICQLREALLAQCSSDTRILLRAIMLGALHGPKPKGTPSYFSNQSPRTFAPKPKYAVKFWTKRNMHPVEVDVLSIIDARAKRYLTEPPPSVVGKVLLGDSRVADTFADLPKKARLVVTSPPYFGMRTYLPDQWLRLWFLGGPDYVEYRQPEGQLEHSGADHFAADLGLVWRNVVKHTTKDARLIIRFGGIHDRDAEPMDVLKKSLLESGWKMKTVQVVPAPVAARRQAVQFGTELKEAKTEYDVYCYRA